MHHKKIRDSRKYQSIRRRLSRACSLSTDCNNLFKVYDESGSALTSGKITRETFPGREGFYVGNFQLEIRNILDVKSGSYLSDRIIRVDTGKTHTL
jgi:hypothetical protein